MYTIPEKWRNRWIKIKHEHEQALWDRTPIDLKDKLPAEFVDIV